MPIFKEDYDINARSTSITPSRIAYWRLVFRDALSKGLPVYKIPDQKAVHALRCQRIFSDGRCANHAEYAVVHLLEMTLFCEAHLPSKYREYLK